jgi:hypothetical protein
MNKLKILFVLLSLSINLSAQSFLKENKNWNVYVLPDGATEPLTLHVTLKDTIIKNLKSYLPIYESYNINNLVSSGEMLREDSNRIFCLFTTDTLKELLLYDFNLKVGDYYYQIWDQDTQNEPYVVDSIVVRDVMGIPRKHWYFSNDNTLGPRVVAETWIEGIGSLTSPDKPIGYHLVGAEVKLLCVHEGDTQIYQNPEFNNCGINPSSSSLLKSDDKLIEIITQKGSLIKLSLKDQEGGKFTLFGYDGKILITTSLSQEETVLNVAERGMVIYYYINKKGQVQTGKFIVK